MPSSSFPSPRSHCPTHGLQHETCFAEQNVLVFFLCCFDSVWFRWFSNKASFSIIHSNVELPSRWQIKATFLAPVDFLQVTINARPGGWHLRNHGSPWGRGNKLLISLPSVMPSSVWLKGLKTGTIKFNMGKPSSPEPKPTPTHCGPGRGFT